MESTKSVGAVVVCEIGKRDVCVREKGSSSLYCTLQNIENYSYNDASHYNDSHSNAFIYRVSCIIFTHVACSPSATFWVPSVLTFYPIHLSIGVSRSESRDMAGGAEKASFIPSNRPIWRGPCWVDLLNAGCGCVDINAFAVEVSVNAVVAADILFI